MSLDSIEQMLIAIIPSLTAIGGVVGVAIGLLSKFSKLISTIANATNIKDVKKQLEETNAMCNVLMEENKELKRTLNKTLTKLDNVYREEETQVVEVK